MYLGIEIGGTKLQLGVGRGDGPPLVAFERRDVRREDGAEGIRRQIEAVGRELIERHGVQAVGIGFGGPVDPAAGRTLKSHQVEGWDDFPLVEWCQEKFGLPAALANDSDSAGLAEALFGAGRGAGVVFYSNVGSGIGGALVIGKRIYSGSRGVASEIGHLRPGLHAQRPDQTVEAIASGFGIAAEARARLSAVGRIANPSYDRLETYPTAVADVLRRCDGNVERLTGKMVAEAAAEDNQLAQEVLRQAVQAYGWAIAQMITFLAPEVVVIGGGVPQMGEALFLAPLRREVDRYCFPPLHGTFRIVPAALGEEVVVYGALAVAAQIVR